VTEPHDSDDPRDEPRWITVSMLLALHSRQVERYGGAQGVIDENVMHSALARAMQRFAYDESADIADLAASYLTGFARAQGFRDGNKRIALAAALVFLDINGYDFHVALPELYAMVMHAASKEIDDNVVAEFFRSRMTESK
jgi:death-on-curing protein